MQIRRNENSIFPNVGTNVVSNNKLLAMVKTKKEDTSVSVTISKAGRERARALNEMPKKDDYMKRAESKIDRILDTIREGGALSKEEEELLNNELKNLSEQKYNEYKNLRLKPEDVMIELKENYMRRERLFFEMQKQMEIDTNNQAANLETEKVMEYMQEKENDEKIIEMIKEYAEDEDETESEANAEFVEEDGQAMGDTELNVNVGEEPVEENPSETVAFQEKAMKKDEKIETEMSEVEAAYAKSRNAESDFAKALEEDYKRIQNVLSNDEFSAKEKVKAFDRFVDEARVNARGKEVQRIKKQFDRETLMMAKIMMLGQSPMNQASHSDSNFSMFGTEFMKSFLI